MNLRDLKIEQDSLGKMLLVDVKPGYLYKDNVKQEEINHYVYTVALPKYALEKINVKIEGKKILEKPDINFPEVAFTNLDIYVYFLNGRPVIAGKATDISLVGKKA